MSDLEKIMDILESGKQPSQQECSEFVNDVFSGRVEQSITTKILKLLNEVGLNSEILTGFAQSMRKASKKVKCNKEVVDNCGTGGDGLHTFNISTTASIIASCCNVYVAKHGNKSITSKSGSADLLSATGIKINISPDNVSDCIDKLNFGFMFAPLHHSSMKYVAESRKEIAPEKTIFNLLGPLTNPADAKRQLIGVYDSNHLEMIAKCLFKLNAIKAKVIHSADGLDEVSLFDKTEVIELLNGKIIHYDFDPSDYFNISNASLNDIKVDSIDESLDMFYSVINNEDSTAKNISILNSAFILTIANDDISIKEAIKECKNVVEKLVVKEKLRDLVSLTQTYKDA